MSAFDVIMRFPSLAHRDTFLAWLSDGGGEQDYFFSTETHDDLPITSLDYTSAFPAWGWDGTEPPIVVAHIDDDTQEAML